jgi:hypothetical protein
VYLRQLSELGGPELLQTGWKDWRPKIPPPHLRHTQPDQCHGAAARHAEAANPVERLAIVGTQLEHILLICSRALKLLWQAQIECMLGHHVAMVPSLARGAGATAMNVNSHSGKTALPAPALVLLVPCPLSASRIYPHAFFSLLFCTVLFCTSSLCLPTWHWLFSLDRLCQNTCTARCYPLLAPPVSWGERRLCWTRADPRTGQASE